MTAGSSLEEDLITARRYIDRDYTDIIEAGYPFLFILDTEPIW